MNFRTPLIFILSLFISLAVYIILDAAYYEVISVYLTSYFLLSFLDGIGKNYNINHITILFAILQLLIMPMVVYRVYNDDRLVIAFIYNMNTPEEEYFGFILPAIILMIMGMEMPIIKNATKSLKIKQSISDCRNYLKGKSNIGITMMIIGLSTGIIEPFVASELKYIAYLFSKLLFVGIFYVLFSEIKSKKLYLIIGISALLIQTIVQGMFGELVYTLILGMLLVLLGQKIAYRYKIILSVIGFVFVIVLQTIKADYRAHAWRGESNSGSSNTEVLLSLFLDRLKDPSRFFDKEKMFPVVVRFNQGMIQDKVMNYVPSVRPFAEGSTISNSLLASFVPRFLWPDKPIAGGHWNMEYFTGLIIEGYSMNIGPFGEAYGNFGKTGGVIFMFFYGLFFNLVIVLIIRYAKNKPTIILWFPVLFLNSIQIETDILMTVNSLLKNLIFVSLCYWSANRFMRIQL
jgi:hypothetical protein